MIRYGKDAALWMQQTLEMRLSKGAQVVLLTDENTRQLCLPVFHRHLKGLSAELPVITIPAGETHKNLEVLSHIWQGLTDVKAGRDALLICLGGGMVTDIGGFAASTYKRGIEVVHVPTTLLGMVDAAIGGKTGIDFQHYKNHLGTFHQPLQVLVFKDFLLTLPERQLRAGFAEVVKYALINGQEVPQMPSGKDAPEWDELIARSAQAKLQVVQQDPTEKGLRKVLNFGHTVGHAIEAYALSQQLDLLHGEAVAAGMLSELWLSRQLNHTAAHILTSYEELYRKLYTRPPIDSSLNTQLIERMKHDKKNAGQQILFVLIGHDGRAVWDVPADEALIIESLEYLYTF
ncbi:MAG: 3-dehydroquinate synthase [Bacteroidetes bacterium]|nr:3-dehydroquinate synthase [Bacteroidota bacterium]